MHVAEGQTAVTTTITGRQRDRRRGLGDIVSMLARAVGQRTEPGAIRAAFEQAVARTLPVRAVALRDATRRWPVAPGGDDREAVAFEVTGSGPGPRVSLEATFDRTRRLGEWDFQVLGQAAQLAALVLELERTRGQGVRPVGPAPRPRRDGAAPLIGSTPAMTDLRARIERVANTDFTVLLEGETRAELANPFWRESARKCADWQMARTGEPPEMRAARKPLRSIASRVDCAA